MRILIISPFENVATRRGVRNLQLHEKLLSRGHDVTLVTGDFDHAKKDHIPIAKLSDGQNTKVIRVPGYKGNVSMKRMLCHLTFSFRCWAWARKQQWDVVFVSSVPPEALVAATLLKKKALVVDVRDIWPDALQAYGRTSFASRIFQAYCGLIYQRTLKYADRIMIVAPGFREWLRRYMKPRPGQVKLVPLGFRREDFRPLSEGGNSFAFCYAGGATPQFDIREFKARFGQASGVVVGSGPLIKNWKNTFPNTEFRGSVSREEAMSMMASSRQLLFPSNPFAQLPNKAFDYFALGHPVLLGENCSRATKSLLALRHRRRAEGKPDHWKTYQALEKEAVTARAATIIEELVQ